MSRKVLSIILSLCLVLGLISGIPNTVNANEDDSVDYSLCASTVNYYAQIGDKITFKTFVRENGKKVDSSNSKFTYKWEKYNYFKLDTEKLSSDKSSLTVDKLKKDDFSNKNREGSEYRCELYVDGKYKDYIAFQVFLSNSGEYLLRVDSNDIIKKYVSDNNDGYVETEKSALDFSLATVKKDSKVNIFSVVKDYKNNSVEDSSFSYKWYKTSGSDRGKMVSNSVSFEFDAKDEFDERQEGAPGASYRCELYIDGKYADFTTIVLESDVDYSIPEDDLGNRYYLGGFDNLYVSKGDSATVIPKVWNKDHDEVDINDSKFSFVWEKRTEVDDEYKYTVVGTSSMFSLASVSDDDFYNYSTGTSWYCTLYVNGKEADFDSFEIFDSSKESPYHFSYEEDDIKYAKKGDSVTFSPPIQYEYSDDDVDENDNMFSYKWYKCVGEEKGAVISTSKSYSIASVKQSDFRLYLGGEDSIGYRCELYVNGKFVDEIDYALISNDSSNYKLKGNNTKAEVNEKTIITPTIVYGHYDNDYDYEGEDVNDAKYSFKWYRYVNNQKENTIISTSSKLEINSVKESDFDDGTYYECELYVNGDYSSKATFKLENDGISSPAEKIMVSGKTIVENSIVQGDLPTGISYDKDTNTLTLSNYTNTNGDLNNLTYDNEYNYDDNGSDDNYDDNGYDSDYDDDNYNGDDDDDDYYGDDDDDDYNDYNGGTDYEQKPTTYGYSDIYADGDLNIVVKGNNTLLGEIVVSGRLMISGDGYLNLECSEKSPTGIMAWKKMHIKNTNISITGNTKGATFYGITMFAWENYKKGFSNCHVKIDDSVVNISNTVDANLDYQCLNIGIDTQDTDLIINNSIVNIEMTHGCTWGFCTGLHSSNDDKNYGGKFSVDDKSQLVFKGIDSDYPDLVYATSYYQDDINSTYCYTGYKAPGIRRTKKNALGEHTWISSRSECTEPFMELTPNYRDSDYSSVNPDGSVEPGDGSGDDEPEIETTKVDQQTTVNPQITTVEPQTTKITPPTVKPYTPSSNSYTNNTAVKKKSVKKVRLSLRLKKSNKVKYSKVKRKKVVLKKAIRAKYGKYKLHYYKVRGSKRLKVNSKGHIIVKKGTKKGKYKIKVNIWGYSTYGSCDKNVTIKVRVK